MLILRVRSRRRSTTSRSRQSDGTQGSILQATCTEHHIVVCYRLGFLRGHLLPRLSRGYSNYECQSPGSESGLSCEALLHFQHAYHLAVCTCLQCVFLLAVVVQALQVQHAREPFGTVAGG